MSIVDRIKAKIVPTNQPTPTPELAGDTSVAVMEKKEPPKQKLPVTVGEYLPWKGIVFKIIAVEGNTFTAQAMGLTKARAEKLGINR